MQNWIKFITLPHQIPQVSQFQTNSQLDYSVLFTKYLLNKLNRKPPKFTDPLFISILKLKLWVILDINSFMKLYFTSIDIITLCEWKCRLTERWSVENLVLSWNQRRNANNSPEQLQEQRIIAFQQVVIRYLCQDCDAISLESLEQDTIWTVFAHLEIAPFQREHLKGVVVHLCAKALYHCCRFQSC